MADSDDSSKEVEKTSPYDSDTEEGSSESEHDEEAVQVPAVSTHSDGEEKKDVCPVTSTRSSDEGDLCQNHDKEEPAISPHSSSATIEDTAEGEEDEETEEGGAGEEKEAGEEGGAGEEELEEDKQEIKGSSRNRKKSTTKKAPVQKKRDKLQCDSCKKKFRYFSKLQEHLQIHAGDRRFKCTVCGKKFIQQGHLTTHGRTHSGLKPYSCEDCGKSFTQSGHLKTHVRSHTGEKPFACRTCKKTFGQRAHLKQHQLSHEGTKPYECDQCGKMFSQSVHLRKHMKSHSKPAKQSTKNKKKSKKDLAASTSDSKE